MKAISPYLFFCLILPFFFFSCTSQKKISSTTGNINKLPRKVAILPFSNSSGAEEANIIVRRMFYNFFSSLNYFDVEPFQVDSVLKNNQLYETIVKGKPVDVRRVCTVLGVDGLIFGDVTTFGKFYMVLYSEVRAGLHARMVSCRSGKTLWEREQTSRIRAGGFSMNPLGIASTTLNVILNLRQKIIMRAISDLALSLTETIPNPPIQKLHGPKIKVLVHNGAYRLFTPGEKLRVVLIGQPGMKASWEIFPFKKQLLMSEKSPGIYTGEYQVESGVKVISGQIIGHLRNQNGGESKWLDVLGPVTLARPTRLSGRIIGNRILEKGIGPFIIDGMLVIGPRDSLTIGPGVSIWVNGLGIAVKGGLFIKGTSFERVNIMPGYKKDWKGIFIDSPSVPIKLEEFSVSGAKRAIVARNTEITIKRASFFQNNWAVTLEDCNLILEDSSIKESEVMGLLIKRGKFFIKRCEISGNAKGGVLVENSMGLIKNSNLFNNGEWNFKVHGFSTQLDINDNWWGKNILDNKSLGILGNVKVSRILPYPVKVYKVNGY